VSEEPIGPRIGWVAEHHRRYVASNGADGHTWRPGVPALLLTTRGRKTGLLRRTPLIYGELDGRYLVVASYGGSPSHPDWYLNLRDDPEVVIQVGDRVMPARAWTADGDERARAWGVMTELWPAYDNYQARTRRLIPVVAIEPR
jgi:deazaflavin-dependent oxidoreductase (nitroreductase family)